MGDKMKCASALCILFVAFFVGIDADPAKRTVSVEVNPGCQRPECKEGVNGTVSNVVKVTAKNDQNTIFYLVSNIGVPTVLMVKTKPKTDISLDWDRLLSNDTAEFTNESISVHPPGNVIYSSALVFTRLIEYNDTKDEANVSYYAWNETALKVHHFADLSWKLASNFNKDKTSVVLNATVMGMANGSRDDGQVYDYEDASNLKPVPLGYMDFVFNMYGESGRDSILPHMMHGDNDTQVDFNIAVNATFLLSRFALETSMFNHGSKSAMTLREDQSLDDEYTPGIFRTMNWLSETEGSAKQTDSCFLQWRRVSYQMPDRRRNTATGVSSGKSEPVTSATELLESSLAFAFFKQELVTMSNGALNVSFGLSKDGTHAKNNFTSWSCLYGIGVPYQDTMSILVISIISVGLGLPVLIIILGTILRACCRKSDANSSPYQVINGDVSPSSYAPAINT